MSEEETVTWGEVCKNVQFADGLYRTCREKVAGFDGFQGSDGDDEDDLYDPETFSDELAESALEIPPPPGADWRPEGGVLSQIFEDTSWVQWAVFAAALGGMWWLLRPSSQAAPETASTDQIPLGPPATSTRAA